MNKKKIRILAIVACFLFIFFMCNGMSVLKDIATSAINYLETTFFNVEKEVKSVTFATSGFESDSPGDYEIVKSAEWTGINKATIEFKLETNVMTSGNKKDVIFVVDTSGSMAGAKYERLSRDYVELLTKLLNDPDNSAALVMFGTESKILSGFTNDKDLLIEQITSLPIRGSTNYYSALKSVDEILSTYEPKEDRDCIVVFLTDGYPTINNANQVAQFEVINAKYGFVTIQGVQYEMGVDITEQLKEVSHKQYSIDMDSLRNVLFDVTFSPHPYQKFEIVDYIDNENFYVESVENITTDVGTVELVEENGQQKVIWNVTAEEFLSGEKANMKIDVVLKDEQLSQGGLYSTNEKVETNVVIDNKDKSYTTTQTPVLQHGYEVFYDVNTPAGCILEGYLTEEYNAFVTVEKKDYKPVCPGYVFKGWETEDKLNYISSDYFIMPTKNVTFRATWTKFSILKSMDGKVYEKQTLYKAIASQSVMDNVASEFVTYSKGIRFNVISSDTNGKGVYTLSSTINDMYPIHYFRGAVTNNNVLFANYCWKIVRTTETGGVKLIFNGSPTTDGQCINTTGTAPQLTTKVYNSTTDSLAYAGYMFDSTAATSYANKSKKFTSTSDVLKRKTGMSKSSYYYSKTATYDGNKYVLGDDASLYTWESNYKELGTGYYTCLSNKETSCTTVIYVVGSTSSYAYYIEVSSGNKLEDVDNMTMSTTITDNGDGTYTLSDPVTIKKSEWYANYSSNKNYYTCPDPTSTTCNSLRYITSPTNYTYEYINVANNYLYGNSFTWDGTNYTLQDTKQFWNWESNYNTLNNHHYTCFDTDGVCTTLYYIHYTSSATAYYIQLKDGKSVENALDAMLNTELTPNSTDSTIKDYIDNTWYASNMTDYTKYLENTIWCNDKSIYRLNGWNPNGGSTTSYLYFGPYQRSWSTFDPSLECDPEDSFTLSEAAGGVVGYGNNALDYPVGLLTSDEVMLAGGRSSNGNSNYYLYTSEEYWTMVPSNLRGNELSNIYINPNGNLNGNLVDLVYGVRPAVSLIPDIEYISGDGSADKPYVILTE